MQQILLFPNEKSRSFLACTKLKKPKAFGGSLAKKGKRKQARPIDINKPIHLVLRSKENRLFRSMLYVEYYTQNFADQFDVKIYRMATVSNHIHLLVKFNSKECYIRFIRALTGSLAKKLNTKWECLPYTRVVTWGREFDAVKKYVTLNMLEAFGAVPYKPRKVKLDKLHK